MGDQNQISGGYEILLGRFLERRGLGSDWVFQRPLHGSTSQVFFAQRAEQPDETSPVCCVRAFAKRSAWERYRRSLQRLERLQAPAPRLMATSGLWDRLVHRGEPWLLAESFLQGPLLCDVTLDEPLARDLGASLAMLHSHTAPTFEWGSSRYRPHRFGWRCLRMVRRRIEAIGRGLEALDLPQRREQLGELNVLGDWFESQLSNWAPPQRFSLVHTELDGDDMIWLPQRRQVAWIDVEKMRYNHRGFDLEILHRWIVRQGGSSGAKMLEKAFEEGYWAALGSADNDGAQEARAAWEKERPIFAALCSLARWAARLKVARRRSEAREGALDEAQNLRRHLNQLVADPRVLPVVRG